MKPNIIVPPKWEERAFEKLKRDALKLHVPVPVVKIFLEVTSKEGKLLQRYETYSHSWVRNAYNLLFIQLGAVNALDDTYGAGKLNVKSTGGVVFFGAQPLGTSANNSNLAAGYGYTFAAGDVTGGILVGSGVNAENFEDYVLQTLITNGAGAGQLSYALSNAYTVGYVAGTRTMSVNHVRYMNNNSGGDVLVNEVALVVHGYKWITDAYWVQSRDHLAATVTVPNASQLKVTYVIALVYPA
jgi:hypothetical protein